MTLIVSYERPEHAVSAVSALREKFPDLELDVHSPYHLHELDGLLPTRAHLISRLVFGCGLLGASAGYFFQYLTAVKLYPFQVGGTPPHSWPAFLPVTFEMAVLLAAFGAVLGTIWLCDLPRYHHPDFDLPGIERASVDRFVLVARPDPAQEENLIQLLSGRGELHVL